jgi:hypothetical protein
MAAARHLAEREQRTVGQVISALARQGLSRCSGNPTLQRNCIPLPSDRADGPPVTLELVDRLRHETA